LRATKPERGIAIVAALWASAIFAVIVLSVMQIVRADARVGRGREDVAQLNAVADAAINITVLSMLGPRATQPPVDGSRFTVSFAGKTVRISVRDEAGKIDLNMASIKVLTQLLISAGLDSGAATALASRIDAWRGTNSGGAEAARSGHSGLLQSVEELQSIPGITPGVYARLVPLVTVYSQTPRIDPEFSTLAVLNVYRPIDPNAEVAWRHLEEIRAGLLPPDPAPGVTLGHAFSITAEVDGPQSARVIRRAVVRLTGQPRMPVLFYRWS
jgi:general secretion pathway protein K